MKYIITGHLGQIGIELKKELDKTNECVLAMDKRIGDDTLFLDGYEIKSDIFFHLAADCKINECIILPLLAINNCISTYEALEYCRENNIKKFIYFSSSRILNDEVNPYTASKTYGEELCRAYKQCYNIDYIIIRPSTVYGGKDETKRLIDIWINNAKENKDLEIFGDENKTLSFTYISDFINSINIILEKGEWNKSYNIFGITQNLKEVAEEIIIQINSKSKIIYKESEISQPQKVTLNDKYLESLGYKPKVNIKEGIKLILEK